MKKPKFYPGIWISAFRLLQTLSEPLKILTSNIRMLSWHREGVNYYIDAPLNIIWE